MEEALLPYLSPHRQPIGQNLLISLPEDDQLNLHLTIRSPRTPSALKEKLIFGTTDSELEDQYYNNGGDHEQGTGTFPAGLDFLFTRTGTPKSRLGYTAPKRAAASDTNFFSTTSARTSRFAPEEEREPEAAQVPTNFSTNSSPRIRPCESGLKKDIDRENNYKVFADTIDCWDGTEIASKDDDRPPKLDLSRFASALAEPINDNVAGMEYRGNKWDKALTETIMESSMGTPRPSNYFVIDGPVGTPRLSSSFVMDGSMGIIPRSSNSFVADAPIATPRCSSFVVDNPIGTPRSCNSFVMEIPEATTLQPNYEHIYGPAGNSARRKSLPRARTAPAMAGMGPTKPSLERPKLNSGLKQAFIGLLLYLSVGTSIYFWNQDDFSGNRTHPVVDALYFCIVTMCTIGYGDIAAKSITAKLFACMFVLVGFGFVDILLTGMMTYFLDKQENLLLSAVEGSRQNPAKNYFIDVKKGRMRIRMKVALALGVVIVCIGAGTAIMHIVEGLGWVDSLYLSVMSVTTVGYGDLAFKTFIGRLFASIWLLVSTLAVARAFLYLAELRIDKRHRAIAKWVLHKDMTVGDLVAADMDNNGFVSKSEYVIYKLQEMGKVEQKDVVEICRQFNRLDTDNCGKITLSYLLSGQ
eukprot:Gb_22039 [translate_table: standard]